MSNSNLTHNWIFSLFLSDSNKLWVGTFGGGLNSYSNPSSSFTHGINNKKSDGSNLIESMTQTSDGNIWFTAESEKLYYLDKKNNLNSINLPFSEPIIQQVPLFVAALWHSLPRDRAK